jgi:hypothetical protein
MWPDHHHDLLCDCLRDGQLILSTIASVLPLFQPETQKKIRTQWCWSRPSRCWEHSWSSVMNQEPVPNGTPHSQIVLLSASKRCPSLPLH